MYQVSNSDGITGLKEKFRKLKNFPPETQRRRAHGYGKKKIVNFPQHGSLIQQIKAEQENKDIMSKYDITYSPFLLDRPLEDCVSILSLDK